MATDQFLASIFPTEESELALASSRYMDNTLAFSFIGSEIASDPLKLLKSQISQPDFHRNIQFETIERYDA